MSIGVVVEEKKEEYKFVYRINRSINRNFMKGVVKVLSRRLGLKVLQRSTGRNSSRIRTSTGEVVAEQQ